MLGNSHFDIKSKVKYSIRLRDVQQNLAHNQMINQESNIRIVVRQIQAVMKNNLKYQSQDLHCIRKQR